MAMTGTRMTLLLLRTPLVRADSEVISPLRTFWVSISVMMPREPET